MKASFFYAAVKDDHNDRYAAAHGPFETSAKRDAAIRRAAERINDGTGFFDPIYVRLDVRVNEAGVAKVTVKLFDFGPAN